MIGCIFGQASETGARTGHLGSSTDLARELLFPLSSTKFLVDPWLLCLGREADIFISIVCILGDLR
jgi:hypothetical protein